MFSHKNGVSIHSIDTLFLFKHASIFRIAPSHAEKASFPFEFTTLLTHESYVAASSQHTTLARQYLYLSCKFLQFLLSLSPPFALLQLTKAENVRPHFRCILPSSSSDTTGALQAPRFHQPMTNHSIIFYLNQNLM